MDEVKSSPENSEQNSVNSGGQPKGSKKILLILLVVILLVASLFGVWYWQQRKINDLNKQIDDSENQASQSSEPDTQTTATGPESITQNLPNGQKITYPLNANNADVMWWSGQYINNDPSNNYFIYLSSQKIVRFLATIPSAKQQEVCGETMYMNISAFQMGALTLATKKLDLQQQYFNCVQTFADSNDPTYGATAKQLDTEVKQQLQAFVDSAVIQ